MYSLLVSLHWLKNEVERLLKYVNLDYCRTCGSSFLSLSNGPRKD